ncbi:MAG: putative cytokinetic ring protein SteA [Thermoleophilia bacterium]
MTEVVGKARLGRRTKDLVKRLQPGDLAIIDHLDLDRVSAEELVESGVSAVVNIARSTSGRFPNPGPLELVRAGVCLVDVSVAGEDLFTQLSDGETVTVRRGSLWRNEIRLAEGVELTEEALVHALAAQQGRVTLALEAFADNTLRHLRDEGSLLANGIDFPPLTTRFRDRHAVVIARGPGYKSDLRIVRPYIRNFKPVLVAVDGGADALLEIGLRPDVIVGDFDSVSDLALASGAELLVHAYTDGRAPGSERLQSLGLAFATVSAPGISEDIALLLAHERGAELIVAVGTHFNLVEFLERNRDGMASTFVTRLKVGESLVDAKGVSRLVAPRIGVWPLIAFAAAGISAVAVAVLASPALRTVVQSLGRSIGDAFGL